MNEFQAALIDMAESPDPFERFIRHLTIDDLATVLSGPYAGLDGIVTWTVDDSVWLRLDGDAVDLRFRRADVGPA